MMMCILRIAEQLAKKTVEGPSTPSEGATAPKSWYKKVRIFGHIHAKIRNTEYKF
jgi:hypothetical protein